MKIDDLHDEWTKDQDLDLSQIDKAIRKVPLLHGKWWKFYTTERQTYAVVRQERDKLRHDKFEWYVGRLSEEDRIARGWPPQPLRIVRQDVERFLSGDAELIPYESRIEMQEIKLKLIEDVIKSLNNRGYLIKTSVDYLRFSNGQ